MNKNLSLKRISNKNLLLQNSFFDLLVSNVFIVLLTCQQLIQFIYDSKNVSMPLFLLFGYLACEIITFYFILKYSSNLLLNLLKNVPLVCFISYVSFLIFSSGHIKEFIGLFIYKDGILNWLFLGIGLFYILSILKKLINLKHYFKFKNFLKYYFLSLFIIYLIYSFIYLFTFEDSNALYQRMSINVYLSFLIILPILKTIYIKKDFFKPLLLLLSMILIITYLNLFSRSTATIVYWISISLFSNVPINIFYFKNSVKLLFGSFISLFVFLNVLKILQLNQISINGSTQERISALIERDIDSFSPLMSRVEILKYFPRQFNLSPLFGIWSPERIAGPGEGFYMHSMILSVITHTGILGTALFLFFILQIFYPRIYYLKKDLNNINSIMILQFFGVFMIANISYFFNFPPFWFLIGFSTPGIIKSDV